MSNYNFNTVRCNRKKEISRLMLSKFEMSTICTNINCGCQWDNQLGGARKNFPRHKGIFFSCFAQNNFHLSILKLHIIFIAAQVIFVVVLLHDRKIIKAFDMKKKTSQMAMPIKLGCSPQT